MMRGEQVEVRRQGRAVGGTLDDEQRQSKERFLLSCAVEMDNRGNIHVKCPAGTRHDIIKTHVANIQLGWLVFIVCK